MNNDTSFSPLVGRCRCELVRFRMESAPIITHACHCRLCQRFNGSSFTTCSMIETDRITLESGKTKAVRGTKSHTRIECVECNCMLWLHREDLRDLIALVAVGTLDEPERLPPEAHYFVRSKHPWITLPADIPTFETIGDPGKPGVRERIMAALHRAPS